MTPDHAIRVAVDAPLLHVDSRYLRDLGLVYGHHPGGVFSGPDFTRKRVKRAESLYRAGSAYDSVYAVRSGFFKSSVVLQDGRCQVTGFHMAGEVLGMLGIASGRHAADVTALEDSEVSIVPAGRLEGLVLQRELQKAMSRELVRGQSLTMMLGTMRAEERLASFLVALSQRFAACGLPSIDFRLRMTRDEIGSYLGLSLETVSRLFSRFQERALITVRHKHIRILDADGLEAATLRNGD